MALATHDVTAEDEIRGLLDSWLQAVKAQDVPRIMTHYAPDVLAFDAIMKLQFKGAEEYGAHWKMCMEMCPGPMTFEMHEVGVEAGRDLAFCHYICHCGGTDDKGELQSGWMRVTVCCRKAGGKWLIAHEHFSAPFDCESGKALTDLKP